MKNYSYLIDQECSGKKTPNIVRKTIPILVEWAKRKETKHTYGDLIRLLGYQHGRFSKIGHPLGCIKSIFKRLEKEAELEEIPTLNALVANAKSKLPSEGFSYVYPDYDKMEHNVKRIIVEKANNDAINYNKWDNILALLGLKPYFSQADEDKIRSGAFSFGGEGKEHKEMKDFIAANPKLINTNISEKGICEHILLSGDRLDVYFPKSRTIIEVKPKSASDADILRGLFQCIKYKAILNAEGRS